MSIPYKLQPLIKLHTVNFHLQKTCNYKCTFCFAHFDEVTHQLNAQQGMTLLSLLKSEGDVSKINYAGGEPLLNEHLGIYLQHAKDLQIKNSIVTNATKLTKSWIKKYGPLVDQIAVSCDSLDSQLQKKLGRGFGQHTEITARAFDRINEFNSVNQHQISKKLNTVVNKYNYKEDWGEFILKNDIQRWKIFKILLVNGENDESYDELSITDEQFKEFVDRHWYLKEKHNIDLAPEDNDAMEQSYVMINPQGQFYQNGPDNEYLLSEPILDVGVVNALQQVGGWDFEKFVNRGGIYEV